MSQTLPAYDVGSAPRLGGREQPALPGMGRFKRVCPECGEDFETDAAAAVFCSDAHKAAFHNRSSKIGRSLVPLAQAWRLGRNAKGQSPRAKALRASAARAFGEMCRLIDAANTDDLGAGRVDKLFYVRGRSRREGTLTEAETAKFHEAAAQRAAKGGEKGK